MMEMVKLNSSPIYIIAEIGINHDGDVEKAYDLIVASADAGVDAVKFQYRNTDNAYSDAGANEIGDEMLKSEIKRAYIGPADLMVLRDQASELGLDVGISFFDSADVLDFGDDIHAFDFFKLPSAELPNQALISDLLELDKHLYISTGCHAEKDIEAALSGLSTSNWTPLHCVSNYPVSLSNPKLGYIDYLQKRWGKDVGYSSHDDLWEVCLLAIAQGAKVIERHITFDKNGNGLDHSSSSTPDEFKKLVDFCSSLGLVVAGDAPRVQNQGEILNKQNLGRSFFAKRDLKSGECLQLEDLVYRAPNIGLTLDDIEGYLNDKPLQQPVNKGTSVSKCFFSSPEIISDEIITFAHKHGLALPVRLHDIHEVEGLFPIGGFEFHLSYKEVLSDISVDAFSASNRYSIHLPDYINATQLMDPFADELEQRALSRKLLDKTAAFAKKLEDLIGREVPVVGSFSVVHESLPQFYNDHVGLIEEYKGKGIEILPQWLPPIAWYFGGSQKLDVMNNLYDVDVLLDKNINICMDLCHLILGRNAYGFEADEILHSLKSQTKHLHIADASGIDGEGMPIGAGVPNNTNLFDYVMDYNSMKVIEVWQGHLNQGEGFRRALTSLHSMYG